MMQSSQPSQESSPRVIAAIPCFNVGHSIGDVVSRAKKCVDQVVVIDDGSTDSTAEIARAAGALVVGHNKNEGYGAAVRSCFEVAKANGVDALVTLDGDGQHNPDEIKKVIAPILNGEADMVIGTRFPASYVNMPKYRSFGIRVITFLFNFGSKLKIHDAQSGFRAYSKRVLEAISPTELDMSISIETIIKARAAGFGIKEVAITCQYNTYSSTINPVIHGLGIVLKMIKLRLKYG